MQIVEHTLPGEGFGASLVSRRVDGFVVVTVGVFVLARWQEADAITRDTFLVAGHLNGMKGTTLARLAFVLPSYVTRTLQRYERGGAVALWQRERPGPKPVMGPAERKRALELRHKGRTLREIATRLGVGLATVAHELKGVAAGPPAQATQEALPGAEAKAAEVAHDDVTHAGVDEVRDAAPPPQEPRESSPEESIAPAAPDAPRSSDTTPTTEGSEDDGGALRPGARLAPNGAPHRCRYAGTLLVVGALRSLGLEEAMTCATVARSRFAVYSATQAVVALSAAWAAGHPSLESMHERDAGALGVVLGLERSPSVRTLWRAIGQMTDRYDPVQWRAGWMRTLARTFSPALPVWGVDGHFKAYAGDEPIDKGWNTKRRLAEPGLETIRLTDLRGVTWSDLPVRAGEGLHGSVVLAADALREAYAAVARSPAEPVRPVVLAFDRGGFDFDVLNTMAAREHWYLAWVPKSVTLPDLNTIAPPEDGVGEAIWTHPRLQHASRLLVQRDGRVTVPATTNLPPWLDAAEAMALLRAARGMEENSIKAARHFVPIDHLDDRGAVNHRPDDRPATNPARKERERLLHALEVAELSLRRERPVPDERPRREITQDLTVNAIHQNVVRAQIRTLPAQVPRWALEPEAERAELDLRNRQLLLPLKDATENARRWLLASLGAGLSPSDLEWDQDTRARTLEALLQAPGVVCFETSSVEVTIELFLPPQPHRRLAAALLALDDRGLRFLDGRALRFRLAPRPTRAAIPGAGLPS